jgi:hypothetical protein
MAEIDRSDPAMPCAVVAALPLLLLMVRSELGGAAMLRMVDGLVEGQRSIPRPEARRW